MNHDPSQPTRNMPCGFAHVAPTRHVVGPLVERLRQLDGVVEGERRAPRLLALSHRRGEPRIDVDGRRRRVRSGRTPALSRRCRRSNGVGEAVVDRAVGLRLRRLAGVAARRRRRAGRARHADGRAVGRWRWSAPAPPAARRRPASACRRWSIERRPRQVAVVERQRCPLEAEVHPRGRTKATL